MDDRQFSEILHRFNYSWSGYRKVRKGVKKRLARHMQDLGCRSAGRYLQILERNEQQRNHFERLMTVSISRFFRDRELWHAIEKSILPGLAEKKSGTVEIWSAGCACGEEAYTVNMAIFRALPEVHRAGAFRITATDMNPDHIQTAKKGIYGRSSLKGISERIAACGFDEVVAGKRYAVKSAFRVNIRWKVHEFTDDAPGTGFDIVLLRNSLLTYYSDEVRLPVINRVVGSLRPCGWLIIGSREVLPAPNEELVPLQGFPCVFQRFPSR
jgi:chemotaxis protein methyltransferase CheR